MDAERFASLLRTISHSPSRRSALRILAGSVLGGALGWLGHEEAEAGRKKRKKRKNKKRGCPEDSFECPDGTCVPSRSSPGSRNCCHGEPCGDCGVCVNGACAEVPGICDTANCQRCSRVHWSCESSCGAGIDCCRGECCNAGEKCADGACRDGCYFCGTLPVCCKTDDGTVYGCCAQGQTCVFGPPHACRTP
jgi:hypothetical protein